MSYLNVFPDCSFFDVGNYSSGYPKLSREHSARSVPSVTEIFSNIKNVFFRELRLVMFFSVKVPSLAHGVMGVISCISGEKMIRVYARPIITFMKDIYILRQLHIICGFVRKTMRPNAVLNISSDPKICVPVKGIYLTFPIPAFLRRTARKFGIESRQWIVSFSHGFTQCKPCESGCQLMEHGL